MIVIDLSEDKNVRCLDRKGRPLCGRKAEGAFVVENLMKVTCPVCIEVSNVPRVRLTRPGTA